LFRVSKAQSGQVIPSLVRKVLHYPNEEFIVRGSGNQYRDFVYIDDIVDALLLVKDKGMNKGVIEIGTAKATTVAELAKEIVKIVGIRKNIEIPIRFDTCQPEGDRGRIAAEDKALRILGWKPKITLQKGLQNVVKWMQNIMDQKRILYIVIGQARGGDIAWKSLKKHFLDPYKAHLATFFTNSSPFTVLQKHSQFTWSVTELGDWGEIFDQASRVCNNEKDLHKYHKLCGIPGQWAGFVGACPTKGSSSFGLLLAFRWLVSQKVLSLNLQNQYDYFVLSRSDFLYLCNHFDVTNLKDDYIYVPSGENYGGWTDRHVVASTKMFLRAINITQDLVCNSDHWYNTITSSGSTDINLETTLKIYWDKMNIPVMPFDRSFFTVKKPEDPTRWSHGAEDTQLKLYNLLVKYLDEKKGAVERCGNVVESKAKELSEMTWD
jgi:hypothetical protein